MKFQKNVSKIPKRELYDSQTGTIKVPNGNHNINTNINSKNDDDDRVREASPSPQTKTETSAKPYAGPTDLKGAPLIIDQSDIWKHMLKFPDIPTHIVEEAIHKLKQQSIPITCPKRYVESVSKNLLQVEKNESLRIKSYTDKNKIKDKKEKDKTPEIIKKPTIKWGDYEKTLPKEKRILNYED